jgi:hypothetical protein
MSSTNRTLHFVIRAWLLVILAQLGASHSHAQTQTNAPAKIEALAFTNMEAFQVFQVYRKLSGLELDISPGAMSQNKRTITVSSQTPLTEAEVCQLLEKALREQAGFIITKIDAKKATVTFDTALPIKPVVPPPPPAKVIRTNNLPSSPPSLPPPPANKKQ